MSILIRSFIPRNSAKLRPDLEIVFYCTLGSEAATTNGYRRMNEASREINNMNCYIARGNAIRDWLICGNVALDKCNVCRRATSKQLLPSRKQNGGFEFASL